MLLTHKSEISYLEHARIYVQDGVLCRSLTEENGEEIRFGIPYNNTVALLLGPGCSITTAAALLLDKGKVVLGFCGGQGTPLFVGSAGYPENAYAQIYVRHWMDPLGQDELRKKLFRIRIQSTKELWKAQKIALAEDAVALEKFFKSVSDYANSAEQCSAATLLGEEGKMVKDIYAMFSRGSGFRREHGIHDANDRDFHKRVNGLLDAGNYFAYGLAAASLWALGVPSQFPLIHGRTRNGGLIFDIADIIKDGIVIPWAFEQAKKADLKPDQARIDLKKILQSSYPTSLWSGEQSPAIKTQAPKITYVPSLERMVAAIKDLASPQ